METERKVYEAESDFKVIAQCMKVFKVFIRQGLKEVTQCEWKEIHPQ